jgi:hypothetical protein
MTKERDIERLLDRWFSERTIEVADRVLDDVADRIGRQPQQPVWRVSWRDSQMQTNLKTLLAAAAVVVVAVVGFAVLRPGSGSNVGGAASPSPSVPASPSASAVFPQWYTNSEISAAAGILPAGKATSRAFVPRVTFTVPEGWVNDLDRDIGYGLFPDMKANKAEYALSGEIAQAIFVVSVESPYFFCEAWEPTQGTAAERSAFLVASDAFVVSEPVDVTIGGLTGKQIDVRLDPDRPTATCPGDASTVDLRDQRTRVTYLDTPSGIIGIAVGSKYSAGHEAFLADSMPIVQSFQFDLSG